MDIKISCSANDPVLAIGRECLGFNVRKTARALANAYDEALSLCGLKNTQFTILAGLHVTGPITINEFSKTLSLDRTTLTRNLVPLERQELLEIHKGPDRRTKTVSLTVSGEERLQQAIPLWQKKQEQLVARIGEENSEELRSSLSQLTKAAKG